MSTVDNKSFTIAVHTIDIQDFLVTAIIPEKWSHNGKSYEKTIRVLEKCDYSVEVPIGTEVRLIDGCRYTLVEEYMDELPSSPQIDLIITLGQGTYVIEDGGLPYKLAMNVKARLPENCKFKLYSGTKLQGPTGLLILKDIIKVELVLTKPEVEIKPPTAIVVPKRENNLLDPITHLHKLNDLTNSIKCCAKSGYADGYINSLIKIAISEYLLTTFGICIA